MVALKHRQPTRKYPAKKRKLGKMNLRPNLKASILTTITLLKPTEMIAQMSTWSRNGSQNSLVKFLVFYPWLTCCNDPRQQFLRRRILSLTLTRQSCWNIVIRIRNTVYYNLLYPLPKVLGPIAPFVLLSERSWDLREIIHWRRHHDLGLSSG